MTAIPFSWDLPSDLLQVSDFQLAWDLAAPEGAVATATTTVLSSETAVLVSRVKSGSNAGFVVGLKPIEWRLDKAFPDLDHPGLESITFENIALVISEVDVEVRASALGEHAREFYAKVYAADDFDLVLTPGVNLIAAFPAKRIGEQHLLNQLFDRLGIDSGAILLQGTLGRSLLSLAGGASARSILKDVYLRAALPKCQPRNAPSWFKSGQLALEISGQPSVGFVGETTVDVEGDVLTFSVAAKVERDGAGAAVALVGGLVAEEPWVHPFGLSWLILERTVIKVSVNTTASIGLGFAATMTIGDKDIDVAVLIKVNVSGVITNVMFDGKSVDGISLADLAAVQAAMPAGKSLLPGRPAPRGIPLDQLPPMEIRDIHLKFARQDDPDLQIERGLALKGELFVTMGSGSMRNFAGVDFSVSDAGIIAKAHIGAFAIGAVRWDDGLLDLELTMARQNLTISGGADLGFVSQDLGVSITRNGAFFSTETILAERFKTSLEGEAPFTAEDPVWTVRGVLDNDFNGEIGNLVLARLRAWADDHERAIAAARAANAAAQQRSREAAERLADLEAALGKGEAATAQNAIEAKQALAQAEKAAAKARKALDAAQARLQATPVAKVKLKAQRVAGVAKAHAELAQANAAVVARRAALATANAASTVMSSGPVDAARAAALAASAAAKEAAAALAAAQAMAEGIRSGAGMPIVVDQAAFTGRLDALSGGTVDLDLAVRFLDRPVSVNLEWDFHRLEEGVAGIVAALLERR